VERAMAGETEAAMTGHGAEDRAGSFRFAPLPRAAWTDEARAVFAFWGEPGAYDNGSATNMVMVLAHHPALATAYFTFGKHLLVTSTLPARDRELIVLRVSCLLRSAYEWHYHVGYALNLGMGLDEIAAIEHGSAAAGWAERDAAVLRAVEELHAQSRLSDACRTVLARHFDPRQIIDLVFTIGNYVMLSWAIAALDIEIEDGIDPIGFDLQTRSGASPVARYKPGEVQDWTSNRG
jgi:4-carboxymuconolactone decarboxylase